MNLVIDIGNSAVKCAVFDGKELCHTITAANLSDSVFCEFQKQYQQWQRAIVVNVRRDDVFAKYLELIKKYADNVVIFTPDVRIPLRNTYQTPHTLGSDRLAAAVGAYELFPQHNILIISVGTALTFELVSADGEYRGGNISLGLRSRYKALHHFTGKLPLCAPSMSVPDIGQNTADAITSGVQNGMFYEISGTIEHFSRLYPHLQTILIGGDAAYFAPYLPNTLLIPHLTLIGLNAVLNYQECDSRVEA